uniref:Uncharacterized protein n=1 Tax=Meloidogyne incognita TaxID=6306 RepID=A0A914LR21_MELIC
MLWTTIKGEAWTDQENLGLVREAPLVQPFRQHQVEVLNPPHKKSSKTPFFKTP